MVVYSRDVSMAALTHVATMIHAIGSGSFDPDASRSVVLGGLVTAATRIAREAADKVHVASDGVSQPTVHAEVHATHAASPRDGKEVDVLDTGSDEESAESSVILSDLDDLADHRELVVPACEYLVNPRSGRVYRCPSVGGISICGVVCLGFVGLDSAPSEDDSRKCLRCFR
eukprot:1219865-Amphidinium_carterae.1